MEMKYETKKLTDEIRTLGLKTGADLIGFTSAIKMEEGAPIHHKPSVLMLKTKSIITLACGRQLNEDRNYEYEWGPGYSKTYIKLKDHLVPLRKEARKSVESVKNFLREKGFITVTEMHGWSGILSFKMAAYLSGMGVFGKSSFIVHPKLGPLNILSCILTDAVLQYGNPLTIDVCGECNECIKACKYGAFKKEGEKFIWIGEKCRSYDLIMNPVTLKWTYGPCNSTCANVCPIGK
ncbi:MAG: hypothetical protein ACFFDN_04355 [Candidatus Hodarchaeota archaeon]